MDPETGSREYEVKWKGFSANHNTWHSDFDLEDSCGGVSKLLEAADHAANELSGAKRISGEGSDKLVDMGIDSGSLAAVATSLDSAGAEPNPEKTRLQLKIMDHMRAWEDGDLPFMEKVPENIAMGVTSGGGGTSSGGASGWWL